MSFSLFLSTKLKHFCCCCCSCCRSVTDGSFAARPLSLFHSTSCRRRALTVRPSVTSLSVLVYRLGSGSWQRQNGHSGISQRSKLTPRTLPRAEVTRRLLCQSERNKKDGKATNSASYSLAVSCIWLPLVHHSSRSAQSHEH